MELLYRVAEQALAAPSPGEIETNHIVDTGCTKTAMDEAWPPASCLVMSAQR
jgi:hypothetical protein